MADSLEGHEPLQADFDCIFAEAGCMESFLPAFAEASTFQLPSFEPSINQFSDSLDEKQFVFLDNSLASPPFSQCSPCSQESDSVSSLSMSSDREPVTLSYRGFATPCIFDEDSTRVFSEEEEARKDFPKQAKCAVLVSRKRPMDQTSVKAVKRSKYDAQKIYEGNFSSVDFLEELPSASASDEDVEAKRGRLLEMGNQALYDLLVLLGGPSRHKAKTARRYVVEEVMCRLFPGRVPNPKQDCLPRPSFRPRHSDMSGRASEGTSRVSGAVRAVAKRQAEPSEPLHEASEASDSDDSFWEECCSDPDSEVPTDAGQREHCRNELLKLSHAELGALLPHTDPAAQQAELFAKRPLVDYLMSRQQIRDVASLDAVLRESQETQCDSLKAAQATSKECLGHLAVVLQHALEAALSNPEIRSFTNRIQSFFPHMDEDDGGFNAVSTLETLARKASGGQYRSTLELESDCDLMLTKTRDLGVFSPGEFAQYSDVVRGVTQRHIRNNLGNIRSLEAALQAGPAHSSLAASRPTVSLPQGRSLNPQDLAWIDVGGIRYHRSEHAYLRSPNPQGPSWIGRIEKIFQADDDIQLEIRWCTSTLHDRQLRASLQSSSKRELFLLDGPGCTDSNSYVTLNGKPVVMYLDPEGFRKSRGWLDPNSYYVYRTLHCANRVVELLPRKVKPGPKSAPNASAAVNSHSPLTDRLVAKASSAPRCSRPKAIISPLMSPSSPGSSQHYPRLHPRQLHTSPSFSSCFPASNPCPQNQRAGQSPACHVAQSPDFLLATSDHVVDSDVDLIDMFDTCKSPIAPVPEQSPRGLGDQPQPNFLLDHCLVPAPVPSHTDFFLSAETLRGAASAGQPGPTFAANESSGPYYPSQSPRSAPRTVAAPETSIFQAVGLIRSIASAHQISKEEETLWIRLAVTGHAGFAALARFYGEDHSRFISMARTSFPAAGAPAWA